MRPIINIIRIKHIIIIINNIRNHIMVVMVDINIINSRISLRVSNKAINHNPHHQVGKVSINNIHLHIHLQWSIIHIIKCIWPPIRIFTHNIYHLKDNQWVKHLQKTLAEFRWRKWLNYKID